VVGIFLKSPKLNGKTYEVGNSVAEATVSLPKIWREKALYQRASTGRNS